MKQALRKVELIYSSTGISAEIPSSFCGEKLKINTHWQNFDFMTSSFFDASNARFTVRCIEQLHAASYD